MRIKKSLLFVFYLLAFLFISFIIVCSFTKPQHNLISWQVMVISVIAAVVLCSFGIAIMKINFSISNKQLGLLAGFLGVALFIVGLIARNSPSSLHDYGVVYRNAISLSQGYIIDEDYFAQYSNNVMVLLLLGGIIRFSSFIGFTDPYYMILILGTVITVVSLASIIYLVQKTGTPIKQSGFCILAYLLMLPIWVNSPTLYTDHMSFSNVVVALALVVYAYHCEDRLKSMVAGSISAIVLVIGVMIKITCIIPFIAVLVALCFYMKKDDKRLLKLIGVCICSGLVAFLILNACKSVYDKRFNVDEKADPLVAWVALGLVGEGSYAENEGYVDALHGLDNKNEKSTFALNYIKDNKAEIYSLQHYIDKTRCNYASGYFGADDYIYYPEEGFDNHFMWKICHPFGPYYWRCSQYTFGYAMGIYLIYLLGTVFAIKSMVKGETVGPYIFVCDLSFVGYFIFLMIWEANNRQLYNFLPILLLGMILHINQLAEMFQTDK